MPVQRIRVRLEQGNAAKLVRLKRVIERLPPNERDLWKRRVVKKLRAGPPVAVGGEWSTTTPSDGEGEWDLELANWLDNAYTTVADRAAEVGEKVVTVVTDTTTRVGFGLWPIAIAAAVVLYAFSSAKQSR